MYISIYYIMYLYLPHYFAGDTQRDSTVTLKATWLTLP